MPHLVIRQGRRRANASINRVDFLNDIIRRSLFLGYEVYQWKSSKTSKQKNTTYF